MKIDKIVNNNVVQTTSRDGQELVVMGKGLGFQKKVGDELDETKIEKTFVLHQDQSSQDLSSVYLTLSPQETEIIDWIISRAESELGLKCELSFYVALSDHLAYVFERCREGLFLSNPLSWEIRKFYPREYQIALDAVQMIGETLGLAVDATEASSIALHLLNAQKNAQVKEESQTITQLVTHILDMVSSHFQGDLDEDSIRYHRFVTHVRYFAQRVVAGQVETVTDDFLYEQVSSLYPEAFACTETIRSYISQVYHFQMSKDEQVYLTIHIQKLYSSSVG